VTVVVPGDDTELVPEEGLTESQLPPFTVLAEDWNGIAVLDEEKTVTVWVFFVAEPDEV
jgi:hypothetical protein